MSFNPSQREAIRHKDGPMLVLAGPGSGKTLVITERTRHLITEYGINPANILVITFTRAAATEMKERFLRLMGGKSSAVTFGTFHAVFFMILKHAYHYQAENIIREEQRVSCMREIIKRHRLEYEDESEFIAALLGEIGLVKNSGISLDHYYSTNCGEEVFRRVYSEYHEYLYAHHLIDFEDMLLYTWELFKERKDILAAWQKKYPYILIDEFQDINQIQFEVVRLLAGEQRNLFVVGDDDQSIYRFRGAKPEIMLRFEREIPGTKTVLLDTNYRSQANIVEDALNLIGHNKERFQKRIRAALPAETGVEYAVFEDQRKENLRIFRDICDAVERGKSYRDFAVLFRTNTQPRLLMEQMMEYNIPFRTRDRIPNLYEHWIARDIFAYIRIAQGSRERRDFLQIMNRPKRYLGRECLDSEVISWEELLTWYDDKPWVCERIEKLEKDLKMCGHLSPSGALHYIRNIIGYEEYLKEYADYKGRKPEDFFGILDELKELASGFKTLEEWENHIASIRAELLKQAKEREMSSDGVILSTMHSSKGLEYRIVFIIDANEGITPHKRVLFEEDMEEERRLFYVAMTRAKELLYIFSVRKLYGKKAEQSRFVEELLEE